MEKVQEYWGRRRLEAQVEAGRGEISILNLSNDWLDVQRKDQEEMDEMMDVTGAGMGQEKSEMSLGEEDQFMDVLLESLLVLPRRWTPQSAPVE